MNPLLNVWLRPLVTVTEKGYPEFPIWVSVRCDAVRTWTQPMVGALLAVIIQERGLWPKEGQNPDGLPGDIVFRGEWTIPDGAASFAGGEYSHDVFMVACVKLADR